MRKKKKQTVAFKKAFDITEKNVMLYSILLTVVPVIFTESKLISSCKVEKNGRS